MMARHCRIRCDKTTGTIEKNALVRAREAFVPDERRAFRAGPVGTRQ